MSLRQRLRVLRARNRAVKDWPGLSFYVCVGRYSGFGIKRDSMQEDGDVVRCTLGWIAFCVGFFDVERFIGAAVQVLKKAEEDPCSS